MTENFQRNKALNKIFVNTCVYVLKIMLLSNATQVTYCYEHLFLTAFQQVLSNLLSMVCLTQGYSHMTDSAIRD